MNETKTAFTLIAKWEKILSVRVRRYFLQRMKTRWGSCRHIRLKYGTG
ncbi:YgjP-like metallopeptidase domain-containing protein [Deinococcus aquatilis]